MSASRGSVAHNYFRPSLRILFTAFLETKPQLWKLMSAISGCCIGSSGSPPASAPGYYFGRCCSSELAQLVPLPYSRGRSTCYSDGLHDFSVTIPRCYKDVYVNSFFPRTARLWNSLPTYIMLSFADL